MVKFLFGPGCRFGEAAGLRWRNIADDFSEITFCETIICGNHRNTTKTGKSRTVVISPSISELLRSLSEKSYKLDDLVFSSPKKGSLIDNHNFNRRAWKSIISQIGIEYRKPYTSHALANGANYIAVAEAPGHNPKVMFQNYASAINQQ